MTGPRIPSVREFSKRFEVVAFRLTFIGVVDDRLADYPLSSQGIAR